MITQLDNQSWSKELVTGNAQFVEVGTTIYVVSQVRADNTFAVFKSLPTPPTPGPGAAFAITATYTFPFVDGKNNTSFDPVIAYDATGNTLYIVGTQDDADGQDIDVIMFAYNTGNDTLGAPLTLTTASYVRDSYDICILGFLNSPPVPSHQFVAIAVTNPSIIWQTPTVSDVTAISISGNVLTVTAFNSYSIGQKITFSGLQNAIFLNGVTVTVASVAGDNSSFTASYTHANYTQVGYESGFATWLPGHSLLGFELADSASPPTTSLVSLTVLDSSPFRSGNTFGAVSTYSPDGLNIEVYYESHPKQITFTDQLFSLNLAARNSSLMWLPTSVLKTFTGRYADNRLTVIPNGTTRTILQQFYSQPVHQNALVGNLLLGYFDGTVLTSPPQPQNQWTFHVSPGSTTSSYIQGTLSVSQTQGAFVSYLAQPVYSIRGVWSPAVKRYLVNDRVAYNGIDYIVNHTLAYAYRGEWTKELTYRASDVVLVVLPTHPVSTAYYTAQNNIPVSTVSPNLDTTNWAGTLTPDIDVSFTVAPTAWPLKTSSLDTGTFNLSDLPGFYNNLNFTWLRGSKTVMDDKSKWGVVGELQGSTTSGATFVSDFNVPPVVRLTPLSPVTALRAVPLTFDASGTNDGDLDAVQFTWTYTPIDSHVTLTPNGTTARFLVNRTIGGAATSFIVGVVAVDYNGSTPIHPPMNVTNIAITSNVLTVTTDAAVSLANGESVFLYSLASATFLNDLVVVVTGVSGNTFTANFTHADYSSSDTGKAIANAQFAFCVVNVPANAAPTIDFSHDGITHNPVTLPIQAARNSNVTIHPTYTGITDPDDFTTYTWSQVSGTPIPPVQIISGLNSSFLQFETNGVLIQGDTLVWSLTVSDAVNAPVTGTVEVDVAAYPFPIKDTLQLSRSLWGSIPFIQGNGYSLYQVQPPTSVSFNAPTQTGSLIVAFESNQIDPGAKTFASQSFLNANADDEWELVFITNSASGTIVEGFASQPGTGDNQVPDFAIAEFASNFTTLDQSLIATSGSVASLTTTSTPGATTLVIAAVKLYNNSPHGAMTGAPPAGWTPLLYNTTQTGDLGGAMAAVFYKIVTTNNTLVTFQWTPLAGDGAMETGLTSFISPTPIGNTIALRNTAQAWSPLDISAIFTNFANVKRNSVLDGTDRYLVISPASVLVYGGVSPNMLLLRKLFVPDPNPNASPPILNPIVDAVHTENDWTLVLDSTSTLYRYSSAPLINTDNPDTTIDLTNITSMTFNKVFTTFSFANVRIVILTGPDGCLLLQLRNTDLAVQGALSITTEAGLLYGMDNVQFVRASNVESLNKGKLLLGSIATTSATVTAINITNNTVTVTADNAFSQNQNEFIPAIDAGHMVTFTGLTAATFLNNQTFSVISATTTQFVFSLNHLFYDTTPEGVGAMATAGTKTYETLIDLSHGQIIGTWDAAKLKNQFVTTGEILFEPNDTYAGRPAAPVMKAVVNSGAVTGRPGYVNLVVSWNADRPDLIQSYNLETSLDNINWSVSPVNSGYVESVTLPSPIGQLYYFRVKAFSIDGSSPYSNVVSIHT